jgi:hypothetical protein
MTEDRHCSDLINRAIYPIDQLDNPDREAVINQVRADLAEDGCAVIRNFFSLQGLEILLNEAIARRTQTYYSAKKLCNVYLNDGDDSFAEDHPRNVFIPRTNGFITADLFEAASESQQLYNWEPLKKFLADCLDKNELFIYEDPVSNMIVNVATPGQQFNWHFDTNEFTITMLLKPAQSGGHFEYVPDLRSQQDECYDEVKKVLDGSRDRIKQLELNAGDLQFFLGRYALHRVTENTGDDDRMLLIMSFTEKPGVIGSIERVKDLYGKVTDSHLENAANRVRADSLID